MQNNVRYYIVKRDDQPVVRSVPVARARVASPTPAPVQTRPEPKASVTSRLRWALRRKQGASPLA